MLLDYDQSEYIEWQTSKKQFSFSFALCGLKRAFSIAFFTDGDISYHLKTKSSRDRLHTW